MCQYQFFRLDHGTVCQQRGDFKSTALFPMMQARLHLSFVSMKYSTEFSHQLFISVHISDEHSDIILTHTEHRRNAVRSRLLQ